MVLTRWNLNQFNSRYYTVDIFYKDLVTVLRNMQWFMLMKQQNNWGLFSPINVPLFAAAHRWEKGFSGGEKKEPLPLKNIWTNVIPILRYTSKILIKRKWFEELKVRTHWTKEGELKNHVLMYDGHLLPICY